MSEMLISESQRVLECPDSECSASLQKIEPGLYADESGNRYFYLAGLFTLLRDKRTPYYLFENPRFVLEVLDGIRQELVKVACRELTD